MYNLKVNVEFEIEGANFTENFAEGTDVVSSLHEALCQAIHEQNPEAIKWLNGCVTDITHIGSNLKQT